MWNRCGVGWQVIGGEAGLYTNQTSLEENAAIVRWQFAANSSLSLVNAPL